jgi:hypothetical protein
VTSSIAARDECKSVETSLEVSSRGTLVVTIEEVKTGACLSLVETGGSTAMTKVRLDDVFCERIVEDPIIEIVIP